MSNTTNVVSNLRHLDPYCPHYRTPHPSPLATGIIMLITTYFQSLPFKVSSSADFLKVIYFLSFLIKCWSLNSFIVSNLYVFLLVIFSVLGLLLKGNCLFQFKQMSRILGFSFFLGFYCIDVIQINDTQIVSNSY